MPQDPRLTVLYDADCGLCSMFSRMLHTLDGGRRLRLTPLGSFEPGSPDDPDHAALVTTLHVRDGAGRWRTGGDAVLAIMRVIPVLSPLAVAGGLPGLHALVGRAYDAVAGHRHTIGARLGVDRCRVDPATLR